MKSLLVALALSAPLLSIAGTPPYSDDFSAAEKESRRLTRGPWIVKDKVATCQQDDELYKKFKDHGPVIWYDLDFTDATIRFSMKAEETVKTFVFTINGKDGHIFRFVNRPNGTLIKAFHHEGEPDGILERRGPEMKFGEWIDVAVALKGETANVKIGDYEFTGSHPAIQQDKTTIGLGFSFGAMSFKDFRVE
jgi:hypothetical protein